MRQQKQLWRGLNCQGQPVSIRPDVFLRYLQTLPKPAASASPDPIHAKPIGPRIALVLRYHRIPMTSDYFADSLKGARVVFASDNETHAQAALRAGWTDVALALEKEDAPKPAK